MSNHEEFHRARIERIFKEKRTVLDIGGGLRISKRVGNRYDPSREWIAKLAEKVEYKVMDPVPDYSPDFVGDIHALPFPESSWDAIVCESVLEHVENPIQAAKELHRVTKPGGFCYVYVPFLYYYHPEHGYYKDYWRFTEDAIRHIFSDFSSLELSPVRGPLETWVHLNPFTQRFESLARWIDRRMKKDSRQVSGYSVFLVK